MPAFIAGIILSFTAAMMFGVENYTLGQVFSSVFSYEVGDSVSQILYEIRLPRVMAAFSRADDQYRRSDHADGDAQ